MSEDRIRNNGCNQRGIDCNGGADRIDVCTIEPSSIRCDLIDGLPIHQLTKYCEEAGEDKKIYPVSLIQAIFDGKTGIRLDKILSMCNAIYLTYEGDFEHTVAKVQGVQRRKGLIVTYKDITDIIATVRYKSDDLSDEAWNDSDNWEGWSFDTASSDLMDMITAIFSNIEDYPDIYDAINNQIRLVLQDIFTNINNYPAVKQLIVDTTEDNIDDVLADIFAHLNNYPQVKTAFNNAFRTYINDVFGNVNNYPEVVAVIEDAVKDIFENIDDYSNLKDLIESLVNDQFYFFSITNDTSELYSSSKRFNDYTRHSVTKTVYDELYAAIVAGKTIIIYANHATKASRVSTARIKSKDVYLQYFIRINETQSSDTTDNKPDVRPEFAIINVIINAYDNSNNYVGEYIIVRYGFESFVDYNSNKPNGIPKLNNDGKVAYEQLYPEVFGYNSAEWIDRVDSIKIKPNEYVYVTGVGSPIVIDWDNTDDVTRILNSGKMYKTYIDWYVSDTTITSITLPSNVTWVDSAPTVGQKRYRIEIFGEKASWEIIGTEPTNDKILLYLDSEAIYQALPEDENGQKYLTLRYYNLHGVLVEEVRPIEHIIATTHTINNYALLLPVKYNTINFGTDTPNDVFIDVELANDFVLSYTAASGASNLYYLNMALA